jgi:phage-related holin
MRNRNELFGTIVGIAIIVLIGCPLAFLFGGWPGLVVLLLWVTVIPMINE